jgi:hypothetical protein
VDRILVCRTTGLVQVAACHRIWARRQGPVQRRCAVSACGLSPGLLKVARREVYEAAERAEQRLKLPVNPLVCSRSRWIAAPDPLIQQIRSGPRVWVTGEQPREGNR